MSRSSRCRSASERSSRVRTSAGMICELWGTCSSTPTRGPSGGANTSKVRPEAATSVTPGAPKPSSRRTAPIEPPDERFDQLLEVIPAAHVVLPRAAEGIGHVILAHPHVFRERAHVGALVVRLDIEDVILAHRQDEVAALEVRMPQRLRP